MQVVAAKVITGLADERILQDFAREVSWWMMPWGARSRPAGGHVMVG